MQATDPSGVQSEEGAEEMPASSVMINSPQFSRVLEQMSGLDDGKARSVIKKKTTNMSQSMPSIKVTCFDDERYNEQMLSTLENTTVTEAEEPCTASETGNLTTQQNNERDKSSETIGIVEKNDSNATSCEEENSLVENGHGGVFVKKIIQSPRKCSKGFVVPSQNPNRIISSTKNGNNDSETNKESSSQDGSNAVQDKLKSSEGKTARKSSLNSSESRHVETTKSPPFQRRRYTVGAVSSDNGSSNEHLNNSDLKNRKMSAGVVQNVPRSPKLGDRKHLSSQIIVNGRKKSGRIDLSFKVDSTTVDAQSKEFRKRALTYSGQTQKQSHGDHNSTEAKMPFPDGQSIRRSASEGHLLSDGRSRSFGEGTRVVDGSSSANVGAFPREAFQRKESNKSLGISGNSLSLLKNAGVVSGSENRSLNCKPLSLRRSSTSNLQGVKSIADSSENRRLSRESTADVTQRLNLSPPRTRRVGTPRPSQLDVSANQTPSKSETDLRMLASEDDDLEPQRRISLPMPPQERRLSNAKSGVAKSSLGVRGKLSLSKSETDLRKLVSDEERADAKRASPSSPQCVRRPSNSKPLSTSDMIGSGSSPLTPRQERKIYLAAAKPEPRLPVRAKSRSDLQASSQVIIDQAEKELDKLNERLPHVSMEEVMKSWHTDHRHWNMVSSLVNPYGEHNASKTNMETVKHCRYIREGKLRKKKLSN